MPPTHRTATEGAPVTQGAAAEGAAAEGAAAQGGAAARGVNSDECGQLALLRLCHLVSPALPIGAYAYSQGLEYAVHAGWVSDEDSALHWFEGLSRLALGTLDLPILLRLHRSGMAGDLKAMRSWSARLIAARETAESRAEERHLGRALARVLAELGIEEARAWLDGDASYAALFALAAVHWRIGETETLSGYLWAWSENQVLAAIKLIPLGQSAGLRLLHRLTNAMPGIVAQAQGVRDAHIGIGVIAPVLASALHESQYTRLFRS
jgi:urease accessory protein